MLLVTGPSGSGKGQTLALAAHIIGDNVSAISKDVKFELGLGRAIQTAGFAFFDEFAKNPSWTTERIIAEFNKFLEINRTYSYRDLYIGPVTTTVNSVIVAANVSYGPEIMGHTQLGRRFVFVPLGRRVPQDKDWARTCGTRDIASWRKKNENAFMCDSLLSEIIDDFFGLTVPGEADTLFEDDAKTLGFDTVENSDFNEDMASTSDIEEVKRFFQLVCALDDWKDGYKRFDIGDDSLVAESWRVLADKDRNGKMTGRSNAIQELSLADVLEVDCDDSQAVFCRIPKPRGSKLRVKFKLAQHARGSGVCNEKIPSKLLGETE